jgi:hypothetical protein
MKREDYKIGAEGWIIAACNYIPYKPRIAKVKLTEYAICGGFVARENSGKVHIVYDSQDIFSSAKEACDILENACKQAISEVQK